MSIVNLKNAIHRKYRKLQPVYCSVLGETVTFNRHGWVHISFDGKGHRRDNAIIAMRLKMVLFAPVVIKNSIYKAKDETIEIVIKGKKRFIRFVEIAYKIKPNKIITVVLRKFEEGPLHYYTIRKTKNKIIKLMQKQKSP